MPGGPEIGAPSRNSLTPPFFRILLEGTVAIGAVLKRFATVQLAEPDFVPIYKPSFNVRGLTQLPLRIDD